MKKLIFPQGFWWGGATAAEQAEGHGSIKKGLTQWDYLYKENPTAFFNQIGPEITSDFINRYQSDISSWKEITNLNSVRLSFSWARLFPDGVNINPDGVKYYHDLLQTLAKNQIKVVMTLFHFDLPLWAVKLGGWRSLEVVKKFNNYARFVFDEFDSEVWGFATINEPFIPIVAGYLEAWGHWPNVNNPQWAWDAGQGMVLAHALVVKTFKAKVRQSKIGAVFVVVPVYPRDTENARDLLAAKETSLLYNTWMLDAMIKGKINPDVVKLFLKLGATKCVVNQKDLDLIKTVKLDFIGVNYYNPLRVKEPDLPLPEKGTKKIGLQWNDPNAKMNLSRGWEIYPAGLYDAAMVIKNDYGNIPFYISENGMGVSNEEQFRNLKTGQIDDDYRIEFIEEHLGYLHKAITDGANCFGYHLWAIFDCWSWTNAYKNRYGFFEIDLTTQQRRPKKSAHWFNKVVTSNSIEPKE